MENFYAKIAKQIKKEELEEIIKKDFKLSDKLSTDFIDHFYIDEIKIIKKMSEFITDSNNLKYSDYAIFIGKKLKKIKKETLKQKKIKVMDFLEIPMDKFGFRLSFCNFLKSKGCTEKKVLTALFNKKDESWYEFETKGHKYIYILKNQEKVK